MKQVYRYSIRKPRRVVLVALLITAAVAPGVLHLRLRTDGNALLPADAPEIKLDGAIRDEFGVNDQIAVVIRCDEPGGVFNIHTLDLIRTWTGLFGELEGIDPLNVVSLATEKSHRVFPGTLKNRGFLEPPPETAGDSARIRHDLKGLGIYTGTLVSYDESATAILIGVPAGVDRPRLYASIHDTIAAHGPIPEEVCVVGAPVAESLLGTHILEDLGVPSAFMGHRLQGDGDEQSTGVPTSFYEVRRFIGRHIGLVPIAIGIMALVFLLSFRSLGATMLPLGEVGACLAFVFGLMGWCDVPVYLTIAVLPIILTAMGIADEIHIFSRYRQRRREAPDDSSVEAVETTMDEMCRPVVKTSITTAIGFLSFAISPIGPVQAFGVFTAVGIIFCMLWSLTVIPACLVLLDRRRRTPAELSAGRSGHGRDACATDVVVAPPARPCGNGRNDGCTGASGDAPEPRRTVLQALASVVVRHRYAVVIMAVLVVATAPFGVRRVIVQDSWIDGFSPDSAFYKATQLVNRLFHGTHILLVRADAGDSVISGRLTAADVDHFRAKLPPMPSHPPEALVGQWLGVRREAGALAGVPASRRDLALRERRSQIASAAVDDDGVTVETVRYCGSLKPLPLPKPGEELPFEIRPRPFLSPETIRHIEGLETFIESHKEEAVGGVIGTADYIATTNYMVGGTKESRRCIPAEGYNVLAMWGHYRRVLGEHRLREILDEDHTKSLTTIFLENANYVDTRRLMNDIREYEREQLAPHGIKLDFAGDVAVSQALIGAIVTTQVRSLVLSLLGILAVTVLMGRSLGWGIYCVLPCSLAVLVNFAVMGVLGIPLGVATSMFSAMTLGIGVDYAIHLTERFRHARRAGLVPRSAAVDAVTATGPAVILDAVAIALGFGIMILSQVPSNARLGGLVVLSVATCLAATLLLLPALLTIWQPRALR